MGKSHTARRTHNSPHKTLTTQNTHSTKHTHHTATAAPGLKNHIKIVAVYLSVPPHDMIFYVPGAAVVSCRLPSVPSGWVCHPGELQPPSVWGSPWQGAGWTLLYSGCHHGGKLPGGRLYSQGLRTHEHGQVDGSEIEVACCECLSEIQWTERKDRIEIHCESETVIYCTVARCISNICWKLIVHLCYLFSQEETNTVYPTKP